jgi:adenosyl cobinamide kinase/adenosyl cobinamide phosphate guanylyltransferase
MGLKGTPPEFEPGRFKAVFFGKPKTGKTTCAISFPCPYVIDAELRLRKNEKNIAIMKANKGSHIEMSDVNDIINEVKELMQSKHPFKTLVIDSLTVVQNELITSLENSDPKKKHGMSYYKEAYAKLRQLILLLKRIDMNVIIVCHQAPEYDKKTDQVIGNTYAAYEGFGYLFEAIIEIEWRGNKAFAIPRGATSDLHNMAAFEFNYQKFVEVYGSKIFESDSTPQKLATAEQVKELQDLIRQVNTPKEVISMDLIHKWLSNSQATFFNEMPFDHIQFRIDSIKKKLNQKLESKE